MTASWVFMVIGTLVGIGVIGTRVEESSGGSLAADATLVAPAGPAFTIWSVIYLGLTVYVVHQWLPEQGTDRRHRAIGWWAAASMVLNAVWLLVTQAGWIWLSVGVIVVLALVLVRILDLLAAIPSYGVVEVASVDLTFGLYLGWVAVASVANLGAALAASGVALESGVVATLLALLLVVLAAGIGAALAARIGRWAVAAAMSWGLTWVAVGRLSDQPRSVVVGLVALVAAGAIVAVHARRISGRTPSRTSGRIA